MASPDRQTKCVLLASTADGAGVREQLDARGWTAYLSNDPLPALAELCLLERLDATRRAWGRPGSELALVVVEPSRWPELHAMLSAARRYVPAAALWGFDNGTLTPLAAAGDAGNGAGPRGRTTGPNATPPASYETGDAPPGQHDHADPPHITGDEISMLLDGDFRDGQPPADDEGRPSPDEHEAGGEPSKDPEA